MSNRYMVLIVAVAAVIASGAGQARAAAPASQPAWSDLDFAAAREIPVQYGGRVMPLDTLARQVVWQVTGRQTYEGYDPVGLLLAWSWQKDAWTDRPIVLVGSPELQAHCGLAADQKWFRYNQLIGNERLLLIAGGGAEAGSEAMQRSAQQVRSRLEMLEQTFEGKLLRIVPPTGGASNAWLTMEQAGGLSPTVRQKAEASLAKMRQGLTAGDSQALRDGSEGLKEAMASVHSAARPSGSLIALEVLYNRLQLFQWGWVLTCLAMVVGLLELGVPNKALKGAAWVLLAAGFAALTAGIVMRWRFSGHAPLATMYESLVFMGWGATAIGIVMAATTRLKGALPIVAAVATTILIVADSAPLDSIASPLVPVLRNTPWLTIHVLTIMLAYSAFALAMGIGHVQATRLALGRTGRQAADPLGRLLYGMMLVGCVFLTAGIIFGAIWANKSWGRYWGWDPKETWSLITLLGYMAVLHGRRVGWFGTFGLAVSSIVAFQLVVMTYYGVNFVLGRGLHSYGFSSGGQLWVGLYVLAESAFVLWAWVEQSQKQHAALAAETISKSS